MNHNPAWHAEYLALENAAAAANEVLRVARKALERRRPPANAQAAYDAALAAARAAGDARWEFEMAATTVVDIASLPIIEWARALRGA